MDSTLKTWTPQRANANLLVVSYEDWTCEELL
jgi:hypothetical protein